MRIRTGIFGLGLALPLAALAATHTATTQPATTQPAAPRTDAAKIESAVSAAPASVSRDATVMDYPASPGAKGRVLRQGRNQWTCLPDNPGTPGTDPMCLDRQWMNWMQAYMNKTKPNITSVGTAYMLQGGTDASNTDPFASQPAPGQDWVEAPPHVMIVSPGKWDRSMYATTPGTGEPWIMFPDTPYEHLMMPVD